MIGIWLKRHAQSLIGSAGELTRTPLATLMTVAVIGITLAFPAGLYVAVQSLKQASAGWAQGHDISLFLKLSTPARAAESLAERLRRLPEVNGVDYVSPAAGLAAFKAASGFGDALDALDTNPLPAVLVVHPAENLDAETLRALWLRLKDAPEVEMAQFDMQWVQRLHALLALAERGVWLLTVLLGIAVALIIGNTIRLAIANRRTEVEIIALVGGTPAFIRRPFLYAGTLQGLAGGLTAWVIVGLALALLGEPLSDLAALYGGGWKFAGAGGRTGLALAVGGAALGYAGSRITLARHINKLL